MADSNDLVTLAYATTALAAGNVPTAPLGGVLPTIITAASKNIAAYTLRQFVSQSFDEVATPLRGQPAQGDRPVIQLAGSPVSAVSSVRGDRTTAMTITNTSTANQRASVVLTMTGDSDAPWTLARTGLTLSRTASGVTSTSSLLFASYATVDLLGAAVNALGGGWSATAASGLGSYPSTDLMGCEDAKGAISGHGARLDLFRTELDDYDVVRPEGLLKLGRSGAWAGGWYGGHAHHGLLGRPASVRAIYTAGFAVVPEPIQQVCIELIKSTVDRISMDTTVQSETTKDYSYVSAVVVQGIKGLPPQSREILDLYLRWTL